MELVVLGDEGQRPDPSFAIAARTGWSFNDSLSVAVDYFSRSGTTRHLAADDPAHHLIFPTIDVDSITAGHSASAQATASPAANRGSFDRSSASNSLRSSSLVTESASAQRETVRILIRQP
jgi:hypothetical protein